MTAILILLGSLLLVGGILAAEHALYLRRKKSEPQPEEIAPAEQPEECCGQHAVCEKDSLLAAVSEKIEYYDDEELDRHKGRQPESYTAEETEEFRDILLSMKSDDVPGWARSLQLRSIALPNDVRDELLMIVSEARHV